MNDKKLFEVFKEFTAEMKERLEEKESCGWLGWDETENFSGDETLFRRIISNAALRGEWVDVANLAMIAHYHDEK